MQQHEYHRYFLPILKKLYVEQKSDNFIDITDCLSGTDDQNIIVLRKLIESEFAIVQDDSTVDLLDSKYNTIKFSAKILPLGIDYLETFVQEFIQANKKKPQIGFKTNN